MDIGLGLGATIIICVVAICICVAEIVSPAPMERCAASCGSGRFKAWTDRVIGGVGVTNTPEKCECGP